MSKTAFKDIFLPLIVVVILTAIIAALGLDLKIQSLLFSKTQGWIFSEREPWHTLYHYGNIPGLLFLGLAVIGLVVGIWKKEISRFRKICLLFIFAVVIGPGLFVNVIFKDHWGRPRPRDVQEFGGDMKFCQVWQPQINGRGKSFPCGHASIGFVLIVPWFWIRKRHPGWGAFSLSVGSLYGVLMGIGRMAQGGHFASDVVWAGGIVYITAGVLFHILKMEQNIFYEKKEELSSSSRLFLTISLGISGVILFGLIFLATPWTGHGIVDFKADTNKSAIFSFQNTEIEIDSGNGRQFEWSASGFEFPGSRLLPRSVASSNQYGFIKKGLFTELDLKIRFLGLPENKTNMFFLKSGACRINANSLKPGGITFLNLQESKCTIDLQDCQRLLLDCDPSQLTSVCCPEKIRSGKITDPRFPKIIVAPGKSKVQIIGK